MYTTLNKRYLFVSLVITLLSSISFAQRPTPTPSPTPDKTIDYAKRRLGPTVGMGGSVGGPTGLFTIYDGKTLHKKDFTFSFSYSNYHRDPGQASIGQTQFTFNYGLREKIELFFNAEIYRQIKIYNAPLLSSFYLPNSQFTLSSNQLGTGAAFVLAPINNRGITGALFRPAGNQPFVQFPFIGQPTGNFGILGAPTFTGTMGVQVNAGAASSFPGIGSVIGSILPGIVLPPTTTSSANLSQLTTTLLPSYLTDAPFVNRLYGESSFNSFVIGTKMRFRDQDKLTNFGLVPFYRFYGDNANSSAGFNMLQRGASPGGNRGDLGLIGFVGSRVGPHANISFNVGYIINSSVTSNFFGPQKVTLLDRPNEFVYGFGLDYSYFNPQFGDYQPIFEIRGTKYVGSRTPNAFEHNPVELLVGSRIYLPFAFPILNNIGIGSAYRRHLNPQGQTGGSLSLNTFNPFSRANGFLVQLWLGRDTERGAPGVQGGSLRPSPRPGRSTPAKFVLPCPANQRPRAGSCPLPDPLDMTVDISAEFVDKKGKPIPFGSDPKKQLQESEIRWEGTGSTRIVPLLGNRTVRWDLTGSPPGTYELRALYPIYRWSGETREKVKDIELRFTIPVEACECEPDFVPPPCPTSLSVNNPPSAIEATQVTFSANVVNPPSGLTITYQWNVDHGQIIGANDGPSILVDTTGQGGQIIRATVALGGLDPSCKSTAQGDVTTARGEVDIAPIPKECKAFDKYGPIEFNDEKARLDNFAIFLNQERDSTGYIVAFGGGTLGRNIGLRRNPASQTVIAQDRIDRATKYLTEDRGLSIGRIRSIDGGLFKNSEVDLYICPAAGKQPSVVPDADIQSEEPPIRKTSVRGRTKIKRRAIQPSSRARS